MTFELVICHAGDNRDPLLIKYNGQGHRSKFKVTGKNLIIFGCCCNLYIRQMTALNVHTTRTP